MNKIKHIIFIQMLVYLAMGLFAPVWYQILFERSGGVDKLGLMFGMVSLSAVFSAYVVGWIAHYIKPLYVLTICIFIQSIILLLYIPNLGLYFIYTLQVVYGIITASTITVEQILVAQTSEGKSKVIGTYNSLIQVATGIAMISSGILASIIGGTYVIWSSTALLIIAGLLSFRLSLAKDSTVNGNKHD